MTQSQQEPSISVKDALEFLLNHPRATWHKDWSRADLARAIEASIKEGSLIYDTFEGRLSALCIGYLHGGGRYHIVAFQSIRTESTINCIYAYLTRFAVDYPIVTAYRRGVPKRYYPLKLLWAITKTPPIPAQVP